jgi:hypothetical protein
VVEPSFDVRPADAIGVFLHAITSLSRELSGFAVKLAIARFSKEIPVGGDALSLLGVRVIRLIADEMRDAGMQLPASVTAAIDASLAERVAAIEADKTVLSRKRSSAS